MKRLDERGIGLVLSMIVLAVFATMALTIIVILRTTSKDSIYQRYVLQAQEVAQAGAQDAMLQISTNVVASTGAAYTSWTAGFTQKAFNQGYYTVTVSTQARPWIVSTGYGPPVATIGRPFQSYKFRAATFPIPQISYGVLVQWANTNCLQFNNSGWVDAYNSQTSTTPASFLSSATVYSINSSFNFPNAGHTFVHGSIAYYGFAPGNEPNNCGNDVSPNASCVSGAHLATFYPPWISPGNYIYDNDNSTLPIALAGPGDLNINNTVATLNSGVYVVHNLTVGGGATLTVNITTGPVVIFVTNAVADNGYINNPTGIPGNLIILRSGGPNGSWNIISTFYGIVDAPNDNITIQATYYGAINANSVNIQAPIHTDLDLIRPAVNAVAAIPGTQSARFSTK